MKERYDFYKNNAKRRNLDFDLSIEQFDIITQQECIYCGGYSGKYNNNSFSGYVEGNIVPCCDVCNKMKGVLTVSQWLNHIQSILDHYKKEIGE